jgi:hypothetical protein
MRDDDGYGWNVQYHASYESRAKVVPWTLLRIVVKYPKLWSGMLKSLEVGKGA